MSSEPSPPDQPSGERPLEMPPSEQPAEAAPPGPPAEPAPSEPVYEPPSLAEAAPPPERPSTSPTVEPAPSEQPPIAIPPLPMAGPMPTSLPPPPVQPAPAYPPPSPAAAMTGAMQPSHRFATPSLVMGILSMLGAVVCLCLFWAPLVQFCPSLWALALGGGALYTGNEARREIEASGGTVGGRDQATAGFIMGIIGVIFGLLTICLAIVFAVGLIPAISNPFQTR